MSLRESLNQPEDKEVLRYRTSNPETRDMYLRIVALDKFDGSSWKPSERPVEDVPDVLPSPAGLGPDIRTNPVETQIQATDWYAQNWLPIPYPASEVRLDRRWRFEPEGRTIVGDRGQTTRGIRYAVSSLAVDPPPPSSPRPHRHPRSCSASTPRCPTRWRRSWPGRRTG